MKAGGFNIRAKDIKRMKKAIARGEGKYSVIVQRGDGLADIKLFNTIEEAEMVAKLNAEVEK